MDATTLVRQLVWQNGLYIGLLRMAATALSMSAETEESVNTNEKLAAEIRETLSAALPPFAQQLESKV